MSKTFSYSILQYKHSLLLKEAINVAILFSFPSYNRIEFVTGNTTRLKFAYPDFDPTTYNSIINSIQKRLKVGSGLFEEDWTKQNLRQLIHDVFLKEDSTVLQFTEPSIAVDVYNDIGKAVKSFSELLLPGISVRTEEVVKHDENFIIRKYYKYIQQQHRYLENKEIVDNNIRRNQVINQAGVNLKFNAAWKNGTLNLVRPVSFDLKDPQDIQNKSAQYYCYLDLLTDYATKHHYRFDLLIAKPQNPELEDVYSSAVKRIKKTSAPKRIITEAELESYSEETLDHLLKSSQRHNS